MLIKTHICAARKLIFKPILYFAAMAAIVVFLLFMNNIIAFIIGDIRSVEFNDYKTTTTVYTGFETSNVYGSLDEAVVVRGWVFADAPSSQNRQVRILLKSDCNTYEVIGTSYYRYDDIAQAFQDILTVPGENNGFTVEFSTIGVKNGEYDMYIHLQEDIGYEGVAPLGQKFIKRGKDVIIEKGYVVYTPHPVDSMPALSAENVHSRIETIQITEESALTLSGWAFCETENDNSYKHADLYFVSSKDIYTSELHMTSRNDVYNAFIPTMKINGANHGISGTYDISGLPDGEYELHVALYETDTEQGIVKIDKKLIIENGATRIE